MIRILLRALLALAPRAFRERYGAEVLEVHAARVAQRGSRMSRIAFGLGEVAGLGWAVLRARAGAVGRGAAAGEDGGAEGRGGGAPLLETTLQDIRFAVRTLRRSPGFAVTAVAVLALGIGANTAIFSAANAFLFRPLPFGDADRLVMLYETNPEFGWEHETSAAANALDWRDRVDALQDVALYSDFVNEVPSVRDGEPELLGVVSVTGNFFSVLGIRPELGRGFTWDETWSGDDHVVILSHDFWVSHYGADPSVVGTTVTLGSTSVEIAGIAPAGFDFPNPDADMWSTFGWDPANRDAAWFRRAHWLRPVARLAPGVTPAQADAALQVVVKDLQSRYPETNKVMGAGLMPLRDFLTMDVRRPLMILMGAVVLLLLLACTNVANLMLVRASDRTREVALRVAVGAGRWRVARQMLTEGMVLALAGGSLGLWLGWLGIKALAAQRPVGIQGATTLSLDHRVVLFTVAAAVASGLLFTLAPALRTTRADVHEALKDGGRGESRGRGFLRAAGALVAVEVGLAVLLVVGSGLMIRSFLLMRNVDPGFRSRGVLAIQFGIPGVRYPGRDEVLAFQDDFERRLEARPGIERVGLVNQLPLNGQSWTTQLQAEGWPPDKVGFEIVHRRADRGYFRALDIPLLRGRLFGPGDRPGEPTVVLVNETFARQYFPGEDPVGKKVAFERQATAESTWHTIVGVVGDQKQTSVAAPTRAEVFHDRRQDWERTSWYVVRTAGNAAGALSAVKSVLHEMDPLIPLAAARPLRQVWRASMAQEEFILTLLTAFGIMALLLATVGVYGVTAQAARKRTQEIGIRMALGADGPSVVSMMLRQGMVLVGMGLAGGLVASLAATRVMTTLLYGVEPTDPATLAAVLALLGVTAAVACYVPARRATSVDPVTSLRTE